MAAVTPPLFLDVDTFYGADELGLPYRDLISEGVVGVNDLRVTQRSAGANMSIDVAAGAVWIKGDDNSDTQPTYRCLNDGTVNLAISAADVTNPRKDIVIAEVLDSTFSGVSDTWRLRVITGTPSSTPSEPPLPNNAHKLAVISVGVGASSITNADILDTREPATVGGGAAAAEAPAANLLGNARFDLWSRGGSAPPDGWTLSGGSVAQETTNVDRDGRYAVAISVPSTTAVSFLQRVSAASGTDTALVSWRGRRVTATMRVRASVASRVAVGIVTGAGILAVSESHSGSGAYETLTASGVIPASAANGAYVTLVVNSGSATTVYLASASLHFGNKAPRAIPRHPALDQLYGRRVYERGRVAVSMYNVSGARSSSTFQFSVQKTATPTVTLSVDTYLGAASGGIASTSSTHAEIEWINSATAPGGLLADVDAII